MRDVDLNAQEHARPFLKFQPNFTEKCAEYFYEELAALVPGTSEMFSDPAQQKVMFAKIIELLLHGDPDAQRPALLALGQKHREIGVQSLHLKVGKDSLLAAVGRAAEDLSDEERTYFSESYDEILRGMSPVQTPS